MKFSIKKYVYITEENVDISFLPPMSRRKLSLLDKIALCAMQKCYESPQVKMVFASQYGELDRLRKLVEQYSQENEVSPATFSFSVHNSAVGQFSLLHKIKESYNSVSAEKDTFSAGLIEALITSSSDDVLFCYCDSEKICEGFSCLITTKDLSEGVFELDILKNNKRSFFEETDSKRFFNFLEVKDKRFVTSDGLFEIKNAGEQQ
ncbi:MAG: beta-ketoacyl synthase chain length factor [Clostridium sp.]|nr:beta-ketoacyl synthase chain length factor [Clostridium sp.]